MAAEIRKARESTDVTLTPGSGGIFDVIVDGKKIYTKAKTGRFPKPGEITGLL